MKRFLLTAAAAAAVAGLTYASTESMRHAPKTVQGIDYQSTIVTSKSHTGTIQPASAYPSDPDDLGVPDGNFTFDMIESWAGEGENRAALVIQFNDDKEKNALVFGYRWDGQATGVDMIRAVVSANPRLYALLEYTNVSSPTDPLGGYVVGGLGWDQDDDGEISITNGKYTLKSENGFFEHPDGYKPSQASSRIAYDYDDWSALDPDDFWGSGWYLSYWSYWVKEGDANSFGYSSWGASGRVLSDGSWDGWNFSLNMTPRDWKTFVAAPATIPEGAKTQFEHNGICYTLKSYSSKTVSVCAPFATEGAEPVPYSGDIVIPATFTDEETEYTVVAIGEAAFASSAVTSITLPATVTEIGADAFTSTPLKEVKFAENGSIDQIKKIGERAFCTTAITTPLFPKLVTSIAAGVFSGTNITEANVPEWVTSVGEMAFAANDALASVVLPASVKTIESGAFALCPQLKSIKVETTVPPTAAADCFDTETYATATLTVPTGYTTTYAAAEGWKNFEKFGEYTMDVNIGDIFDMNGATFRVASLGDTNTAILTYKRVEGKADRNTIAAANEAGYTGTLVVPATVKYQDKTFNITAMNDSTFYGASELVEVTLPEGLAAIPDYAFYDCAKLAKAGIPTTVTSVGKYAFSNCSALTQLVLPDGVASIGERAFFYAEALTSIAIPSSLKELPNYGFAYCRALESISIPDGVETIGYNIFQNCTSLASAKLPATLTTIPQYMFSSCSALTKIDIPASVTQIAANAFSGCVSLTEITLPAGLTTLGNAVFQNCSKITEIALPEGIVTLPMSLFYNCTRLEKVTMSPDAVFASNGTQVLRGCTSLATIAYYGEDPLPAGTVKVPSKATTIPNYTFCGCTSIAKVILPEGVKSINQYAFADMGLAEIDLPDGLTTIQGWAFRSSAFKEIVIPASVTTMTQNYICQKNENATFYMCNPEPIKIGTYTLSGNTSSGPWLPVVVPTGCKEAYEANSTWKKSAISAPELTSLTAEVTKVDVSEGVHTVSGLIHAGYDMSNLPEKFLTANTAHVLASTIITFDIEGASRAVSSGNIEIAPDGTFTAEIEGLQPGTAYSMSFNASYDGVNHTMAPQTFTTPVPTGIDNIAMPENTAGDFYNMAGVCVAKSISVAEARGVLPAGIYLFRCGEQTHKLVLR